jgi:hypothetical protein
MMTLKSYLKEDFQKTSTSSCVVSFHTIIKNENI